MCNKNDDGEDTELSNGAKGEDGNDSEDRIIRDNLQSVGGSSESQTFSDTIFHGKSNRCFRYGIDLYVNVTKTERRIKANLRD